VAGHAEHAWNAGAVNIGIQDPDPGAVPAQGQGEVDRRAGLADPALAGCDRDDVADRGQRLEFTLYPVWNDLPAHSHFHLPGIRDTGQSLARQGGHLLTHAIGRVTQPQLDHGVTAILAHCLHATRCDQVHPRVRVDHPGQPLLHRLS
jgi:hypothetical protein